MTPADIYEQALSIWTHAWDDAYAAGLSKAEKHGVRRNALIEYLKDKSIPPLVSYIEGRIMDIEAQAIQNPRRREYYMRERAAAQGILTTIQRSILPISNS